MQQCLTRCTAQGMARSFLSNSTRHYAAVLTADPIIAPAPAHKKSKASPSPEFFNDSRRTASVKGSPVQHLMQRLGLAKTTAASATDLHESSSLPPAILDEVGSVREARTGLQAAAGLVLRATVLDAAGNIRTLHGRFSKRFAPSLYA